MLFTTLFFHPDARRPESIRLGSLIFNRSETGAYWYSHYLDQNATESARARTESAILREALNGLHGFLGRQASSLRLEHGASEEDFALNFVQLLPHNMRVSAFETWPPDRYFEFLETFPSETDRVETRRIAERLATI